MNGNRQPPGQGMPQQDGRMSQGGRRGGGYNHLPYNHQPSPVYNGYSQPYNAAYGPAYNQPFHPNAMNNQGYYPHYQTQFTPQYPGSPYNQAQYPTPAYPPVYGRTPPPTIPQYNPNAQFIPAAAQPRQQQTSSQPSPVVSSTAYQQSPNHSQIPTYPRSSSQASARPSTPSLPQITEPLYAEPEAPEPKQKIEIFVPPVPWFTPTSRVPWPIRYTSGKDQAPACEGYFVWVANPTQISRRGGAHRDTLDIFAWIVRSATETTPTLPTVKNVESVQAISAVPAVPAQSGGSIVDDSERVESRVEVEPESAPEEPHVESKEPDDLTKSQEVDVKEHEPVVAESEPAIKESKAEHSRESSDESHTLTPRSSMDTEAASLPDGGSELRDESPSKNTSEVVEKPTSPALKPPKKGTWADLLKSKAAASASATATRNVPSTTEASPSSSSIVGKPVTESLADSLNAYAPGVGERSIRFLKPRGLVNIGNMCYMNSVLQVLVFCIPFYDFLYQVGSRSTHSFKNDTPLVDAMITFMREFEDILSAPSVERLRARLKDNDLEQYGEHFTPNYIYEAFKNLPRFKSMQRGHQQDAEEFLGFLLEGLHEECAQIMQSSSTNSSAMATPTNRPASPASESGNAEGDAGWHEVGRKQKSAVTRSSGAIKTSSPITKIFGGSMRSEVRVPGLQTSITLQPFQTLPIDIGSLQVNNIVEALKGLTRPETINGDFKGPRNAKTATKTVFIETLPQVLILHLKRFMYYNDYTQKIGRKIGYPLELEIPKEVFSRQQQTNMLNHGGLPKYRLIAVVYHHGKNASGGHYTVDVRRQDGQEWIRLDDTVITRVRSEEVAEGGSEEDPKVLAAAAIAHKRDPSTNKNSFSGMGVDGEDEDDGSEWSQVNGSSNANGTGKSWSAVANGAATSKTGTAPKSKADKFSMNDKVAYLLFYQKI